METRDARANLKTVSGSPNTFKIFITFALGQHGMDCVRSQLRIVSGFGGKFRKSPRIFELFTFLKVSVDAVLCKIIPIRKSNLREIVGGAHHTHWNRTFRTRPRSNSFSTHFQHFPGDGCECCN